MNCIKNYMQIGTIHFMSYPSVMKGEGDIEGTLAKILADPYFDFVEMTWIKDDATRARVRELLQWAHIGMGYGAQPRLLTTGLNINSLDDAVRSQALATLKEGIDEAYYLGARAFAFLSGKYEEATKNDSYAALLDSTQQLCAYAKSKGDMPVLLEVFDYDVDKCSLIGAAEYAAQFAVDMRKGYADFGLIVDLSHLPLTRETASHALSVMAPHIQHIHIGNAVTIKDAPAYGDAHPRFGFPNGSNDVAELRDFLRCLFDIGYLGEGKRPAISFEVKPFGDEDPDIILAGAKRTLDEAWAGL